MAVGAREPQPLAGHLLDGDAGTVEPAGERLQRRRPLRQQADALQRGALAGQIGDPSRGAVARRHDRPARVARRDPQPQHLLGVCRARLRIGDAQLDVREVGDHDAAFTGLESVPTPAISTSIVSPSRRKTGGSR